MTKKDDVALPEASVQLYSLADEFSADMNGSLERLAAIGLKNVEALPEQRTQLLLPGTLEDDAAADDADA